ncbi:MAG: TIGR00282 family metallophosphoesterase [Chthoniobacterales bacterium]|nr:TIGR00282 family metallophosphoesterase [Chthoniobacterales bacterium]
MIRILFLGDVVGEPGRKALTKRLRGLQEELCADFTVVNGENAAGGRGISGKQCIELLKAGATVITTGDHVWDQKDLPAYIETEPRLLRPCNYPEGTPGSGSVVLETPKGPVGVINVRGLTYLNPPLDNPFHSAMAVVEKMRQSTKVIFVDFHAETTSEKIALGRYLDGNVSAVVGTHTHVQTADEQIFPGGTAFLCDAGMCGAADSILGRTKESILRRFLTGMPTTLPVAGGAVQICGVQVDVDEASGRATAISRVQETVLV